MRTAYLFAVVVLLAGIVGSARGADDDGDHIEHFNFGSDFIDGCYSISVSAADLKQAPAWKPEDGNPPVSPRAAREATDKALAKFLDEKEYPGWKVKFSSLALGRITSAHWCWAVTYKGIWKDCEHAELMPEMMPKLTIVVPMTGVAIVGERLETSWMSEDEFKQEAEFWLRQAPPQNEPDWRFRVGLHVDHDSIVTRAMLAPTPDWKADAPHPPLPVDRALAAAQVVQRRWLPNSEDWETKLDSVSLQQLSGDKWAWIVHYEQDLLRGALGGVPPSMQVVVLMDGKAVEPVTAEEESVTAH
jgi:hypothetical protein